MEGGEGEGGLNREGGLINFPPLKRGGGLLERGLNRGFTGSSLVFLMTLWLWAKHVIPFFIPP